MQIKKRLPDGTLGPWEDAFPGDVKVDETVLMLLEALAGQQEQIMMMQEEINQLKGGGE